MDFLNRSYCRCRYNTRPLLLIRLPFGELPSVIVVLKNSFWVHERPALYPLSFLVDFLVRSYRRYHPLLLLLFRLPFGELPSVLVAVHERPALYPLSFLVDFLIRSYRRYHPLLLLLSRLPLGELPSVLVALKRSFWVHAYGS